VNRPGSAEEIYVARHGRVLLNRERRTVELLLEDVTTHTTDASGKYNVGHSKTLVMSVDPDTVFPREGPAKGDNEMTIAELRARAAELEQAGISSHNQWMAIHRKFSIPVACLVFGLIGLALGATNRRDGTLGSFVLGVIIVFAYYIPLYLGPALAKGGLVPPWLAVWLPNIVLGGLGFALFVWRDRVADQPFRLSLPSFLQRRIEGTASRRRPRRWNVINILDGYVATMYMRFLALSGIAMLCVFYISTFIDRSGQVFKGVATWGQLGAFLWYMTPQYIYYVFPLSVLLAALVTIALLTKNSELIVMKACGISLYRVALPMVLCAPTTAGHTSQTERVSWALNWHYHDTPGGHVRIYRQHELELKLERAGFYLRGSHHAHAFHSPYWWLKCAYGLDNPDAAPVKRYHDFLCHLIEHNPRWARLT